MKIITLLPVKNEAWILKYSLENFSSFSDHIIIADQNSSDETVQVCQSFPKVKIIKNPYEGHSNKVRWLLLDEARKIEGEKLIVCLDADELISSKFVDEILEKSDRKPQSFSSEWLQLWGDQNHYRTDGVWKNNIKEFAFFDDNSIDYVRNEVINDHTARIPKIPGTIKLNMPILHYQYLAKERSSIKQAWYMCKELIAGYSPMRINHKYSIADINIKSATMTQLEDYFRENIPDINPNIFELKDSIRENEITTIFKEMGVAKFEGLNIWDNQQLRDYFVQETGRQPKARFYPKIVIKLNNIKNIIKKIINWHA